MTLSLATVGTNAFTDDAKINENYAEAVQVLNGMGVFKGYEDNSFRPTGDITRAEVAAIVYRIYTGDVTDAQAKMYAGYGKFDDVNTAAWYAGYVGYCTNAGFIKGYGDGKFGPNDKVTGYQALAMILRAVGYGKNGEFEGKDWELHVAQVAQQIGALVNTQGEVLKNPASRQLVAELLFRCLQAPQVTYTPAFGYTPVNGVGDKRSLGQKVFDLKEIGEVHGTYGRPGYLWTYKTGDKETFIAYKPIYTSTVAKDECDIAKELGLSRPAKVVEAWLDGVDITKTSTLTGRNDTIDLKHPGEGSNLVGDQGRLTEIYQLANGLSIVEINTYFGEVTKVYGSKVDKNGHKTTQTVDMIVYLSDDEGVAVRGYVDADLAAGDTVLVTLDRDDKDVAALSENEDLVASDIATVKVVEPTKTGMITGYSQRICNDFTTQIRDIQGYIVGTTSIDKVKMNDADKFFVGYMTRDLAKAYDVYEDDYGNIIALLESYNAKNYAVINAIRWNSPNLGTTVGGFVTANLTLADGSVVTDVVVSAINGKTPNSVDKGEGMIKNSSVSNVYSMNYNYYGHIVLYSVNDKGQYALTLEPVADRHNVLTNVFDAEEVQITRGKSTIYCVDDEQINTVYATNNTVFLVYNGKYGYDVYTGYNKVPNIKNADMCYQLDAAGRVKLAVIYGNESNTESFFAYVPEPMYMPALTFIGGEAYYEIVTYKIGETTPTTVLVPAERFGLLGKANNEPEFEFGAFVEIELTDGIVSDIEFYAPFWTDPSYDEEPMDYAGHTLDIVRALTGVVANSFPTTKDGEANLDFDNTDDAKFFMVKNGKVVEATAKDLAAGDMAAVIYDTKTVVVKLADGSKLTREINQPVYVYLADEIPEGDWDTDVDDPDDVVGKVTVNFAGCTVTDANGNLLKSGEANNAGKTFKFVVVTGTTAPSVEASEGNVKLLNSNTATGAYTYELSGITDKAEITISINGAGQE